MLDFKEEELLPELKASLFVKNSIPCISHPLVQTVFYTPQLNYILNQQLIYKRESLKTALINEDWSQFIWLHERPYRFQAIQEIHLKMDRKQFWELLGRIWTDSENIWQNLEEWKIFLSQRDKDSHYFMTEGDRKFLKSLPEKITIYRGYQTKNKKGLSFSLSKTTAEWFASRFNANGKVYERTVSKSEVFAFMSSRNEKEIILV
jgi:hypothetical protein